MRLQARQYLIPVNADSLETSVVSPLMAARSGKSPRWGERRRAA